MTPEPERSLIGYRGLTTGDAIADLYKSAEQPWGAVILVPGLTPYGKDDPRLVSFAHSLARDRFLVLVPEIANTRLLTRIIHEGHQLVWISAEILGFCHAAGANPAGVG